MAKCSAVAALCAGLSFITTTASDADEFGYGMYGQPYEADPARTLAYDEEQEQRATPVEV